VKFPRCSGVLLRFTSLPGRFGIGDLDPSAYEFADFLFAAGQKLWQVLPLNATGYADSPYQCFSAFAGNPMLLSLECLRERGLLQESDLDQPPPFSEDIVDYASIVDFRMEALLRAAGVLFADGSRVDRAAFDHFCESSSAWLDDYALMTCKDAHHGMMWTLWDRRLRRRDPQAVNEWSTRLAPELKTYKYCSSNSFSSGNIS